ncbi:Enoyl-CoA hydratase/isomerase [Acidimicrobium ferrooxidans DSM 10331]|uniref:Enoyl-CoA hydratase/isomerase n=1 Tax=Acidimicrobium ferrooxidans (strain DSM 10331 / JCM 15462 / NBRC 103882 / ICP) TaxID=525909 RepID=C7M3C0_ACIFD|nr:enoyl-CoA hydratase/isomerase family protein [Acidimicrobium ferrooxidans]ACU53514.1 Enoyl-CoA hydratase/isomerase [Acidimicrobium ferrooxidans DSM 10331]
MLTMETSGPLRTITIANPTKANALGMEDFGDLADLLAEIGSDAAAACVVVRGSGKHFSAGIDLDLLRGLGATPSPETIGMLQRGFLALATLEIPTIAAIDGACIGAGLELALACDVRIGTRWVRCSLPEVRFGIVADLGGLSLLPEVVGTHRALALALGAGELDANEARAYGILDDVVADDAELARRVDAVAAQFLAAPTEAQRATKRLVIAARRTRMEAELAQAALANVQLMRARSSSSEPPTGA